MRSQKSIRGKPLDTSSPWGKRSQVELPLIQRRRKSLAGQDRATALHFPPDNRSLRGTRRPLQSRILQGKIVQPVLHKFLLSGIPWDKTCLHRILPRCCLLHICTLRGMQWSRSRGRRILQVRRRMHSTFRSLTLQRRLHRTLPRGSGSASSCTTGTIAQTDLAIPILHPAPS